MLFQLVSEASFSRIGRRDWQNRSIVLPAYFPLIDASSLLSSAMRSSRAYPAGCLHGTALRLGRALNEPTLSALESIAGVAD